MTDKKRRNFNTTFDKDLHKELKILSARIEKDMNELLEEGARHVIKKYSSKYAKDDYLNK